MVGAAVAIIIFLFLQFLLHATQSGREPRLAESKFPFIEPMIGIARWRAGYLTGLGYVNTNTCQKKSLTLPQQSSPIADSDSANAISTSLRRTCSTLDSGHPKQSQCSDFHTKSLDFGMLFSGLNSESQNALRNGFELKGNNFSLSVHKYLLSGPSLRIVTRAAVDRLTASLTNKFTTSTQNGLQEMVRHELTLALTGAIYGPENPYDDPIIEASWR